MEIDVRAAGARFETRSDQVTSRYSFSFGAHYDPANTRFGPLVAHNDELLQPGAGFELHPHRDVDIVTWVVSGALRHFDESGGSGVVRPGIAQRLSAGSGVRHSETNAADEPTRYVQMWITTDDGGPPDYASADVGPLGGGVLVAVASGDAAVQAPLRLRRPGVQLRAGRLAAGGRVVVPSSALAHLFVVRGAVLLDDVPLLEADAARVIDAPDLAVTADTDAEILVWLMDDREE